MVRIAGRYDVRAKLGEGGMGVVYRAYDPPPMDRDVAVKTLHLLSDPLALELFDKECRALRSISHPNIVEVFDIGEFEDEEGRRPFFVMPLLAGQTLDAIIRNASHQLTVDRVVEIVAQASRGLQAAHDHGLVHRDIKPSNIFVMADNSVKLIDFGVAHVVHSQTRTTGFDKGTLLYMAPEQLQHKPVSPQSDIYALAVTAYEALTRRQPFRAKTEEAIVRAILEVMPIPASEINPAVSQVISRVVHKGMAKQPWHRYDSSREFGETLLKAARNEPIPQFDAAKTQPRIQTAARALESGDHQFAGEILSELEAEGNLDSQIALLRAQIDQVARQKTLAQLLESARARFEAQEDPLALQKLQEVFRLDPTNVAALSLQSKIDDRRSERQIEQWLQLARQHVDNHSYGHAREALDNALALRPRDARAARLRKELEAHEEEYVRLRHEKSDIYQSAMNLWKNGEVSRALSKMKVVLDLDGRAPDQSSADAAGVYRSFYDQVRSEHDAIEQGYSRARAFLAQQQFSNALEVCASILAKYPGHALFQALKFDVEEQQRQRLSAFIADVSSRVETEPDLDAKMSLLREAVIAYPEEPHFTRLLKATEDKRDLVNSIVARARHHEGAGQFSEALSDLETLQAIHGVYPGLAFETERLRKRIEQHARDVSRANWVRQVDQHIQAGNYTRAIDLLETARSEFPEDAELVALATLVEQGVSRAAEVDRLMTEGQALCDDGRVDEGVARLEDALQLEDRASIRALLRDVLVGLAQASMEHDWPAAEAYAERALEFDPTHSLSRNLRSMALDRKRDELVTQWSSEARRLQAAGDIEAAIKEAETGLAQYPGDPRLTTTLDALRLDSGQTRLRQRASPSDRNVPARESEQSQPTPDPSGGRSGEELHQESSDGASAGPETVVVYRQSGAIARPAVEASTVSHDEGPRMSPVTSSRRVSPDPDVGQPKKASRIRPWMALLGTAAGIVILVAAFTVTRDNSGAVVIEEPLEKEGPSPPPPGGNGGVTTSGGDTGGELPKEDNTRGSGAEVLPTVTTGRGSTGITVETRPVTTTDDDAGNVPGVTTGPPSPPGPAPEAPPDGPTPAAVAAQLLDEASRREASGDYRVALDAYVRAREADRSRVAEIEVIIARLLARMRTEGGAALRDAKQYDALRRSEDATKAYERALRVLPDDDPARIEASERLRILQQESR